MGKKEVKLELDVAKHPDLALMMYLDGLSKEAADSDMIARSLSFFEVLYKPDSSGNGFRHNYSEISSILYGNKTPGTIDDIKSVSQNAQMISNNLDQIFDALESGKGSEQRVVDCVRKLRDHISLEMQRMTVFESLYEQIEKTKGEFEEAAADGVASISSDIEMQRRKLEAVREENGNALRKIQRDYIAILGIFAAVVLVFNSSIGFSSSAVEVAGTHFGFQNLLLVILVVGLVIVNSVAVLFGFVWRMINDNDDGPPKDAWTILSITNAVLCVCIVFLLVYVFASPFI